MGIAAAATAPPSRTKQPRLLEGDVMEDVARRLLGIGAGEGGEGAVDGRASLRHLLGGVREQEADAWLAHLRYLKYADRAQSTSTIRAGTMALSRRRR